MSGLNPPDQLRDPWLKQVRVDDRTWTGVASIDFRSQTRSRYFYDGIARKPQEPKMSAAGMADQIDISDTADLDPSAPDRMVIPVPPREAPFAAKMAYYRSQHTTRGIRLTHLVGVPGVAASLPLIPLRPRVGIPLFVGSWAVQVAGHVIFEKNSPALTKGFLTYQACGLAFWCEEIGELLAGKGLPKDAPR